MTNLVRRMLIISIFRRFSRRRISRVQPFLSLSLPELLRRLSPLPKALRAEVQRDAVTLPLRPVELGELALFFGITCSLIKAVLAIFC